MKRALDGMTTELAGVKEHLTGVDARLDGIDARLDGHDRHFDRLEATVRNIAVEQARARGDIEWLKDNMLTRGEFKAWGDAITGHLVGLTARMDDMLYGSAKHGERLNDHDRRISALEARRS